MRCDEATMSTHRIVASRRKWHSCPHCLHLFAWSGAQPAKCPACDATFDPYAGAYNEGYYRCACSESPLSLLATIRNGARLSERLVAIE